MYFILTIPILYLDAVQIYKGLEKVRHPCISMISNNQVKFILVSYYIGIESGVRFCLCYINDDHNSNDIHMHFKIYDHQ